MIKAKNSDWAATVNSDTGGNFVFNAVPLGEYIVTDYINNKRRKRIA